MSRVWVRGRVWIEVIGEEGGGGKWTKRRLLWPTLLYKDDCGVSGQWAGIVLVAMQLVMCVVLLLLYPILDWRRMLVGLQEKEGEAAAAAEEESRMDTSSAAAAFLATSTRRRLPLSLS